VAILALPRSVTTPGPTTCHLVIPWYECSSSPPCQYPRAGVRAAWPAPETRPSPEPSPGVFRGRSLGTQSRRTASDSLPPCGGGLGWGDTTSPPGHARSSGPPNPPPRPSPTRGEGEEIQAVARTYEIPTPESRGRGDRKDRTSSGTLSRRTNTPAFIPRKHPGEPPRTRASAGPSLSRSLTLIVRKWSITIRVCRRPALCGCLLTSRSRPCGLLASPGVNWSLC
jgi:hypothetical protein